MRFESLKIATLNFKLAEKFFPVKLFKYWPHGEIKLRNLPLGISSHAVSSHHSLHSRVHSFVLHQIMSGIKRVKNCLKGHYFPVAALICVALCNDKIKIGTFLSAHRLPYRKDYLNQIYFHFYFQSLAPGKRRTNKRNACLAKFLCLEECTKEHLNVGL